MTSKSVLRDSYGDQGMDIVFVIDATGSMEPSITTVREKVAQLASELREYSPEADFRFGCVCYRDPIDSVGDVHEVFDLVSEAQQLSTWLAGIQATGGEDEPEDFVGALNKVKTEISWRPESKHALIWIADAPAHGERYCGSRNHQEEEPKLEPLVKEIAKQEYYFDGLSVNGGADRTFAEMKSIYESADGPYFDFETLSIRSAYGGRRFCRRGRGRAPESCECEKRGDVETLYEGVRRSSHALVSRAIRGRSED